MATQSPINSILDEHEHEHNLPQDNSDTEKSEEQHVIQPDAEETMADKEARLTDDQRLRLSKARAFIEELQRTKFKETVIVKTETMLPPGIVNPGLVSGMDVRSLSLLSRIYVGSINFEITEEHIRKVFSEFGAVKHIAMSSDPATGRHKGFGFVEFDVPESANLALETMDGTMLGGRQLKVGRPNNYAEALASITVAPPAERIFVANINEAVSEDDLSTIFSPFGEITKCVLAPNMQTRKHKGYGFIEFATQEVAQVAVAAMNGFALGHQTVRARKCVVGGPLGSGMAALENLPIPIIPDILGGSASASSLSQSQSQSQPAQISNSPSLNSNLTAASAGSDRYDLDAQAHGQNYTQAPDKNTSPSINQNYNQTQPQPESQPHTLTEIVIMTNVVDPHELDEDLPIDIYEESSKSGTVKKVVSVVENGAVRILVEFAHTAASQAAVGLFDNRWFGGKQVKAQFYSREMFERDLANAQNVFIPPSASAFA